MNPDIQVFPDASALVNATAERITQLVAAQAANHQTFTWALSGGSTPKALYQKLADEPFHSSVRWSDVEVFFGDERCVPPDHPDSNYRMAFEAMLSKLPIPAHYVHRMRGEIDPQQAAMEYGQMLKARFVEQTMDVILLGMGDDGHTASLFPHSAALKETKHRCMANNVEKFKTWRITLTAPFINTAKQVMIMVTGAAKADRVREVLKGPADPERLPIQLIRPASGQLTWLLDKEAAARL